MTNFVENYVDWAKDLTEAPPLFHYYIAYSILSQVIGCKITSSGADYDLAPNLWTVLIGPSGMARKSTALNLGERILRQVNDEPDPALNGSGPYWKLPDEGSRESFFDAFKNNLDPETGNTEGMLIYDEFATLMNNLDKKYNAGFIGNLTSIYGQKTFRNRIGRGDKAEEILIRRPYLNILAATTIDWFSSNLDDMKIRGGFLPRFNIIYVEEPTKTRIHWRPQPNIIDETALVNELKAFKENPKGIMKYDDEAFAIHKEFYAKTRNDQDKLKDPSLSPFITRRLTDLHKFSLMNAVMRANTTLANAEDIRAAIRTIGFIIEHTTKVISDKMHFTRFSKSKHDIYMFIKKEKNGVSHSEVLRFTKMKARDFEDIIKTLIEDESIVQFEEDTGFSGSNSKKKMYKALPSS